MPHLTDLIERVQYKAVVIVSGCWQGTCWEKWTKNWFGIRYRIGDGLVVFLIKLNKGVATLYLSEHIPTSDT